MKIKIAPAVMDGDLAHLADQVALVEEAGADLLHVDIMDGHYVPSSVGGPRVVEAIKRCATIPVDVHLMVTNPDQAVEWFIDAGADILIFHPDASADVAALIDRLHEAGRSAGLALNPDVAPETIEPYAQELDCIVAMTVFPGFSGQKFLESGCAKIPELRQLCRKGIDIYADGGISPATIPVAVRYGANVMAAASAVFASDVAPAEAIRRLRRNVEAVQQPSDITGPED
ncbi:MAG: ribulose-phosphate 3-epimerase [Candidatus Brocadiia bacterium]|nr:ribulose-phosphate 3-epimerase [Candidatus Brocadiia bacterium]